MISFWAQHPVAFIVVVLFAAACLGAASGGPYRSWPRQGQWHVHQMYQAPPEGGWGRRSLAFLLAGLGAFGALVLLEALF